MAREAISEVLATVAHSQDANDWDRLAACFWPDAVYRHPGGVIEGCHDIVERSKAALGQLDASQHLVGSLTITVHPDGRSASASAYFQAQHVRAAAAPGGGSLLIIAGTYTDRLEQRDGEWRIAERVQAYSWREGNSGVIVR